MKRKRWQGYDVADNDVFTEAPNIVMERTRLEGGREGCTITVILKQNWRLKTRYNGDLCTETYQGEKGDEKVHDGDGGGGGREIMECEEQRGIYREEKERRSRR